MPGEESTSRIAASDRLPAFVPPFALLVAVVAVLSDSPPAADLVLLAIPVAAFAIWTYVPGVPLAALCVAVVVPVVLAQRGGEAEPLLFEVSLLAFVVGRCAGSARSAVALGLLAAATPLAGSALQDPAELHVGVWLLGITFPWVVGRAFAEQRRLTLELDATRRELAQQALLEERRRIARDVHDSVGHGVAALMLQVTSARHVMHRDPAAAEEALRSAEALGRRSMQELRETVGLLRGDGNGRPRPPLPALRDIGTLVEDARAAGLEAELRTQGDLDGIAPGVGVALYRIAQEALGNAARHAPDARTVVRVDVGRDQASLVAETIGPVPAARPDRPTYGLIGMRERATALGGELAAGPTPDGWRVSCRVPIGAAEGGR
jgi:signal transduction histidine kinase